MILFNHPLIESENFYPVNSIEEISQTHSNSIVRFTFSNANVKLLRYCTENGVRTAVEVENITEAILASNLEATYILVTEESATNIQKVAETYLFDAKIIAFSNDIEKMALLGVDGLLFS